MKSFLRLSTLLLLLFVSAVSYAQRPGGRGGERPPRPELPEGKGAIVGMVKDMQTEEGIAFANVVLYTAGTEELVEGATTNERGRFMVQPLDYGDYDVIISYIGYGDKKIENVAVNADNRFARAGRVSLEAGGATLDQVEVVAERDMVQFGLEKKSFNVTKELNALGGSAEDVLRNIPSVTFDMDGNISLRGSQNVRILVNGKPSGLTGQSRQAILDQIPASSIQNVEVITNPGAKYDSDGMAGIINIVTKRQNKAGFNMSLAANYGTWDRLDGSVNLNYRTGKFNFFTNLNGRTGSSFRIMERNQRFFEQSDFYSQEMYARGDRSRQSSNVKVGTEYYFTPRNSVTLSAEYQPSYSERDNPSATVYKDIDGNIVTESAGGSSETDAGSALEYNLDYFHRFAKEGQELTGSLRFSQRLDDEVENNSDIFTTEFAPNLVNQINETTSDDKSLYTQGQVDYAHPLRENLKLETGLRTQIRNVDNDYIFRTPDDSGALIIDPELSNRFMYEEQIHAAYASLEGKQNKWNWKAGLRGEQVFSEALSQQDETPFENDYFRLFPSGSIGYAISESQTIQASYSRRTNRPRYRSLNPFVDRSNRLFQRRGNPYLLPEFINSYELNYLVTGKKGTFTTGIYHKNTQDVITRFTSVETAVIEGDTLDITTFTSVNLNTANSYGLELIASYRPAKWLRLTGNANFFYSVVNGENLGTDLTNNGYQFTSRVMGMFTLGKGWEAQLSGFYRSPGVRVQGTFNAMYSADLGLKKSILKGKGALTFRLSDIFDTREFSLNTTVTNSEYDFRFKRESRIAYIGFTYSLRQDKKKGRRGQGRRGGGGGGDDMDF